MYEDENKAPTTLFELSNVQYKRMMSNSIHVSGIHKSKGVDMGQEFTLYTKVIYGSSISITKKNADIGQNKRYKYVNVSKTKKRFFLLQLINMNVCVVFPIHIYLIVQCQIYVEMTQVKSFQVLLYK